MKKFTEPEILVSKMDVEDVITASGDETPNPVMLLGDDQLFFG